MTGYDTIDSCKIMVERKNLPVHFYQAPHGRRILIDCSNVYPADRDYFLDNDIRVSMEELAGDFIAYGCPENDKTEESEVMVFARGRSCEDTLAELALVCNQRFNKVVQA